MADNSGGWIGTAVLVGGALILVPEIGSFFTGSSGTSTTSTTSGTTSGTGSASQSVASSIADKVGQTLGASTGGAINAIAGATPALAGSFVSSALKNIDLTKVVETAGIVVGSLAAVSVAKTIFVYVTINGTKWVLGTVFPAGKQWVWQKIVSLYNAIFNKKPPSGPGSGGTAASTSPAPSAAPQVVVSKSGVRTTPSGIVLPAAALLLPASVSNAILSIRNDTARGVTPKTSAVQVVLQAIRSGAVSGKDVLAALGSSTVAAILAMGAAGVGVLGQFALTLGAVVA